MSRMRTQAQKMIENSDTQESLLETLVNFTEQAKAKTTKAAKFQEATVTFIVQIAQENGRPAGGPPTLGDHILVQQHHKIAQWEDKAFCLSEKQMAVIVRENWDYIK